MGAASSQGRPASLPPTSRSGPRARLWTITTFAYSCPRDGVPGGVGHQAPDRQGPGLTSPRPGPPETRRVGTFPNTKPKSLRICSGSNRPAVAGDVMHTRLLIPVFVGSVLSLAAYVWAGSPT